MITDEIVKNVVTDVSRKLRVHKWKGMRRLNLKLNRYSQICHKIVTKLLIRCENITDKTLVTITEQFKPHINDMQKLNFDFSQCHSLTEKGLKNFTTEITRSLPRLRQLHFNYPEYILLPYYKLNFLSAVRQLLIKVLWQLISEPITSLLLLEICLSTVPRNT